MCVMADEGNERETKIIMPFYEAGFTFIEWAQGFPCGAKALSQPLFNIFPF